MGCGCGGSSPLARRPVRSAAPAHNAVAAAAATAPTAQASDSDPLAEERRKIEKLRRDAILRALGRPS